MRLLHAGPDYVGDRLHPGRSRRQRRRNPRIYERQPLPLRRLSQHRRRHQSSQDRQRSGQREGARLMRAFSYEKTDDAVSALWAFRPNAQFLAGGTTLLDLMKLDVMRPDRIIDINGLKTRYAGIEIDDKRLWLGDRKS